MKKLIYTIFNQTVISNFCTLLSSFSTFFLVIISYSGLKTWKNQINTNKKIDLIDQLCTSIIEYNKQMTIALQMLGFIEISIDSHKKVADLINNSKENSGVIEYIKIRGQIDGMQLQNCLKNISSSLHTIILLSLKCDTFWHTEYKECDSKVLDLVDCYMKVESVANIISSPSLNWEEQEILNKLHEALSIKSKDIYKKLIKSSKDIMEFLGKFYLLLLK
ncbi:MAG: hypothetical protein WCK63_19130 [Betaproteobacteria bacterium]